MVYKRIIHADKRLDTEYVISGIENQYCIDELKIASYNVQRLHRGNNSDKIDESISLNSKLYKSIWIQKKNLQTTIFPTSPLIQASTITDHLPMLAL